MGHSRPLFRLLNTVDRIQMFDIKILTMTGIEPWTSLVVEATALPTEPQPLLCYAEIKCSDWMFQVIRLF